MKKQILCICSLICSVLLYAQKPSEMNSVWEVKLNHDFDETGLYEKDGILHGSNEKSFSVINCSDGATKWGTRFKEIYEKINKVDLQIPMYDANVIFLFDKKFGKDQMVVADLTTGKLLWNTDKFQNIEEEDAIFYVPEMEAFGIITDKALWFVKARTGEVLWSTEKWNTPVATYLVDKQEHSITMINMPRSVLSSLFKGFKNQVMKLDLNTGAVIWENSYKGISQKKIYTGGRLVKLSTNSGKLFMQFNGLQVYDFTTGTPLWNAFFDATFEDVVGHIKGGGKVLKKGVYGCVADPLVDGDFVYVIDMKSKRQQYLKKYKLNSGELVWTSPEIQDAKVLPGLVKINDYIVLQVGGSVEVQAKTQKTEHHADGGRTIITRWQKYYQNIGPFNVQAFKTGDGTQVWESEKFKKGITNIFASGNNLLVCSGKALYNLDYTNGKENYEIALKGDDIDVAEKIIDPTDIQSVDVVKDNVVIVGEKGISAHNIKTGEKVWSVRTKGGDFNGIYGKTAFYEKENGDVFAIDINSGKATYCDARKDSKTEYSSDGNYLYVFEKKKITKLKTN